MLIHSGFTTVLDTGSDVENTVTLRKRVESGEIPGPRIFTAGLPLFPAHALPYYLADLPLDLKAKLGQPETTAEAAADVAKNRAVGAEVVKLFTGSIVEPNRITPMRVDIAHAAVIEAHQHGQLVFSYSSNVEGTKVAIDAGVDVLAHTPEATEGVGESMLRQTATSFAKERHREIILKSLHLQANGRRGAAASACFPYRSETDGL